jgi:2-(1,2-epoxy-1,2-dihydrophenyl)acetyl-CoA isomerase
MTDQFILEQTRQGVATLTLNRPDVLNSFNRAMSAQLVAALGSCAQDPDVRAILITGAGRGFCAGQDLSDVPEEPGGGQDLGRIVRECYNPVIKGIRHTEKPVIAAVNGVAAGAGANLALACDIVIASEDASFIQSFSKVGLVPDSGGTFMLPRLIGVARATALMMLAEKVTADQAKAIGMIWDVCPNAVLMDTAFSVAANLASSPTKGLGLIKRALNASMGNGLDAQLDVEEKLQGEAGRTEDYREGIAAFLAKRKPVFTGR